MIISCNTNSLNKAIQTVQRAIISKPSTPIFSGIHVIAADNKLEIQAMDLNMAMKKVPPSLTIWAAAAYKN